MLASADQILYRVEESYSRVPVRYERSRSVPNSGISQPPSLIRSVFVPLERKVGTIRDLEGPRYCSLWIKGGVVHGAGDYGRTYEIQHSNEADIRGWA